MVNVLWFLVGVAVTVGLMIFFATVYNIGVKEGMKKAKEEEYQKTHTDFNQDVK